MKYLVVGPTIVNDVVFADGSVRKSTLGGAVFCMAGIKLWQDSCLYISNVGNDFESYFAEWMDVNQFSRAGLRNILPHTLYTELSYGEQGLFSEVCIYGEEEDGIILGLDKPDAAWVAQHCDEQTKGIYLEANDDDQFWNGIELIRSKGDIKIMWELPTDIAMDTTRRTSVLARIKQAGLYSVNLPEAMSLFQADDEAETISRIIELGVPCYFRVGVKGSHFICDGSSYFAPSLTVGEIVDPTGCGNSSTAAALCGYCEGRSPMESALMGNISAAYNLLQFGPYPKLTAGDRERAIKLLRQLCNK